jgi:hypothetical protein
MSHSGLMDGANIRRDSRRHLQWAFVRWGLVAPAGFGIAVAVLCALAGARDTLPAVAGTIALLSTAGAVVAALLRPPSLRLALVYVAIWSTIATIAWGATRVILFP